MRREAVLGRLKAAAGAVSEIEKSVTAVSDLLSKSDAAGQDTVYTKVQETVCSGCGREDFCWNANFSDSLKAFSEMRTTIKTVGSLKVSDVPLPMSTRCIKLTSLTDCFNRQYLSAVTAAAAEKRIEEIRSTT